MRQAPFPPLAIAEEPAPPPLASPTTGRPKYGPSVPVPARSMAFPPVGRIAGTAHTQRMQGASAGTGGPPHWSEFASGSQAGETTPPPVPEDRNPAPFAPLPSTVQAEGRQDSLSAYYWLFWRDKGGPALASQGRLGGAQAGIRIDGSIADGLNAYGRASMALDQPRGEEAALGLSFRPTQDIPVTLALERRLRLGQGGRNAWVAYGAAGLGPQAMGPDAQADGYVQAGIVGAEALDGFIDGRFALSHPVAGRLRIGAMVSGGAQPGLSRLDAGPALSLRMEDAGASATLNMEWRQRIGGHAAPGSGPVITLSGSF